MLPPYTSTCEGPAGSPPVFPPAHGSGQRRVNCVRLCGSVAALSLTGCLKIPSTPSPCPLNVPLQDGRNPLTLGVLDA